LSTRWSSKRNKVDCKSAALTTALPNHLALFFLLSPWMTITDLEQTFKVTKKTEDKNAVVLTKFWHAHSFQLQIRNLSYVFGFMFRDSCVMVMSQFFRFHGFSAWHLVFIIVSMTTTAFNQLFRNQKWFNEDATNMHPCRDLLNSQFSQTVQDSREI